MYKVNIKPLSVNKAWQGRRFKSPAYREYESELTPLLPPPPTNVDFDRKLRVHYKFYISNKLSDWDNPIKQFQDTLSKSWGFNDRNIYLALVEKVIVKKGEEKIEFAIDNIQEE